MQTILDNSKILAMRRILSNIKALERRILTAQRLYEKEVMSPRCLYHNSNYLKTDHPNTKENSSILTPKCLSPISTGLPGSNLLRRASRVKPVHQSVRNFSDSLAPGLHVPTPHFDGIFRVLVDSSPVNFAQNSLVWLHNSTGLPWWATAILVTCALRTCVTLPLALYQQYIFAKVSNLKYEMEDLMDDLKREVVHGVKTRGLSEKYAMIAMRRSVKQQWKELVIRDNCHPAKGMIVVLVQMPLWILLSAGFRNLCYMLPRATEVAQETYLQLTVEGFGWITNLTQVDQYWILPIALGLINLTNIEVQNAFRTCQISKYQKIATNIVRVVSVAMVPIAAMVPSCICLYWVTSSAYSLVQSFVLASPRVRRFSRIPECDEELDYPYSHLSSNLKKKFLRKES